MRIPNYERQIVNKAAPKVAPTPVFEEQRAAIGSKQKVFSLRGNLNTIRLNRESREGAYDLKRRGLAIQQRGLNETIRHNRVQEGIQIAQLGLKTANTIFGYYQASVDAQTTNAINSYNQEKALYENELQRKNYQLGDTKDIESNWNALQDSNADWKAATIDKVLSKTNNNEVRRRVEEYIAYDDQTRLQQQRYKFEDAMKAQWSADYLEDVNTAASLGDFTAIDATIKTAVQSGVWTPEYADTVDAAAEKAIVNQQLVNGANDIFGKGGDVKDARDFIMSYEPEVSGRNNYVLTTEDREAIYKTIADEKKINDALNKERTQKVYTAETNRLMDRYIDGELTLQDVKNSRLPEAKADGFESQFSQKYFVDLLEKKVDKDATRKSNPQVLSELYLGLEDRQKTYNENYTAILKAFEDEDLINSDYRILMNRLNDDTTVGAVVKTGTDTLEDAFRDGIIDDSGYTSAMNEYWDTVKARNLDTAAITEVSKNLIVKYARKDKDAMQWLGVENDGRRRDRYDGELYLESNRVEEVNDPLWERHVDESKTMTREDYETAIQKAAKAEFGRPLTVAELDEYKEAHTFEEFQRNSGVVGEQIENYDTPEDFQVVNDDFNRGIVEGIFQKHSLSGQIKSIMKKTTSTATSFLVMTMDGRFFYTDQGNLLAWDEGAGTWRYQ